MPCYANPTPLFLPAMRIVLDITNGFPTIVTTSFAHNYQDGDIVRLLIPKWAGIQQINNMTGTVTVIDTFNFSLPIDSTFFDTMLVVPPVIPDAYTCPQVVPFAEINSILSSAVHNIFG